MKCNKLLALALTVFLFMFSFNVYADDSAQSGFLSDYSKLKPNSKYPGSSDWVNPEIPLAGYKAIIIDPIKIRLSKGLVKDGARPDADLLNEVLSYLHNALKREFSKQIKVVDKPAEHTLHYRAAITGITTEGGISSSAANMLPIGFALRTATGKNTVRANLFMESEYSDSLTGAPVGAVMQSAAGGTPSQVASGDRQIQLKDLKDVLDDWAVKAATNLNEAIGSKK